MGCAGEQALDDRMVLLQGQLHANAHRRDSADGIDGDLLFRGVGDLPGPLEGRLSDPLRPIREGRVEELAAVV